MRPRFLGALIFWGLAVWPSTAQAIPTLQLDIAGGYYDPVTETIVASGNPFTLSAILTPGNGTVNLTALLSQWYFVSAAILPATSTGANLGSFNFAGTTVSATSGMTYGTPPIELASGIQAHDPKDLSRHGIFPTYFSEFAFCFSTLCDPAALGTLSAGTKLITGTSLTLGRTTAYNTATSPGGLTPNPSGSAYYASFQVDSSLLNAPNVLHFDLYSETYINQVKKCQANCVVGDIDINQFAPFSHDAQGTVRQVPEPSTLSFSFCAIATGMLLVGGRKRLGSKRA